MKRRGFLKSVWAMRLCSSIVVGEFVAIVTSSEGLERGG